MSFEKYGSQAEVLDRDNESLSRVIKLKLSILDNKDLIDRLSQKLLKYQNEKREDTTHSNISSDDYLIKNQEMIYRIELLQHLTAGQTIDTKDFASELKRDFKEKFNVDVFNKVCGQLNDYINKDKLGKLNDISNFIELYSFIDKIGGFQSSSRYYTVDDLKDRFSRFRKKEAIIDIIPGAFREIVLKLTNEGGYSQN